MTKCFGHVLVHLKYKEIFFILEVQSGIFVIIYFSIIFFAQAVINQSCRFLPPPQFLGVMS